jgi:hypothetical protein
LAGGDRPKRKARWTKGHTTPLVIEPARPSAGCLGVTEPEQRRGIAETADLEVDIDAVVPEVRVVEIDLVGLKRDPAIGALDAAATFARDRTARHGQRADRIEAG